LDSTIGVCSFNSSTRVAYNETLHADLIYEVFQLGSDYSVWDE
jgi:hypothetical protein